MLCCRATMACCLKGVKPNVLWQSGNNFVNSSACQRPIALKELS